MLDSTNSSVALHCIYLEIVQSLSLQNVVEAPHMRKSRGFSLIELLIVVAIILIIAAIAIPNFMRSKMAANESSAVSSIRTITTAEISYNATYPDIGYASALSLLGPGSGSDCTAPASATSANACLIDNVLQSGTKAGYNFVISGATGAPVIVYAVNGDPVSPGQSGQRHFYSDATGVIRYNVSAKAAVTDSPTQ